MRTRATRRGNLLAFTTATTCLLFCGPTAFADEGPSADEPSAVETNTGDTEEVVPSVTENQPATAVPDAPAQHSEPEATNPSPASTDPGTAPTDPEAASSAEPITPAAPEFVDADLTVTVPQVAGVSYLIDDVAAEPGTHPAEGVVVVTAAASGDVPLTGETRWEHAYPSPDPSSDAPAGDETDADALEATASNLGAPTLLAAGLHTSTPHNPDGWDFSETRTTGHYEYAPDGLNVWTEGNTSTDKAAGYRPLPTPVLISSLVGNDPYMDQTVNAGGAVGLQLVVSACGTTSILVSEPGSYGSDNWWSSAAIITGHPGMGYAFFGTLADIAAVCPSATAVAVGFSLGSGVLGDVTIHKIVVGDEEFVFGFASYDTAYTPTVVPGSCLANGEVGPMRVAAPAGLPVGVSFQVQHSSGVTSTIAAGQTIDFAAHGPIQWALNSPGYTVASGIATQGTVAAPQAPDCTVADPSTPASPITLDPASPIQLNAPLPTITVTTAATTTTAAGRQLPATGAGDAGPTALAALALIALGAGLVSVRRRARA